MIAALEKLLAPPAQQLAHLMGGAPDPAVAQRQLQHKKTAGLEDSMAFSQFKLRLQKVIKSIDDAHDIEKAFRKFCAMDVRLADSEALANGLLRRLGREFDAPRLPVRAGKESREKKSCCASDIENRSASLVALDVVCHSSEYSFPISFKLNLEIPLAKLGGIFKVGG